MNNNDLLDFTDSLFMRKVKQLLLHSNKMVQSVPFSVENYQEVINLWINYKNNNNTITNYEIKKIFEFHQLNIDHIIMYHSFGKDTTLLMCKIREKNKNIVIKNDEVEKIEIFNKLKPNIIATFC